MRSSTFTVRQRCTRKAASLGTKSHLTNQLRGCGRTRPIPDPCVNSPPLNRVRKQGLFEVRVLLSQLLPVSTRAWGGVSVSTHKVRTIGGTSLLRTFLPQAKVAPTPLSSLLVASGQEHSEVRSDNRNPRRLLTLLSSASPFPFSSTALVPLPSRLPLLPTSSSIVPQLSYTCLQIEPPFPPTTPTLLPTSFLPRRPSHLPMPSH